MVVFQIATDLPSAPFLHTLILNGTNLTLKSLSSVLRSTPSLQELHISDNKLELVNEDDTSTISDSVKTIHMNRWVIFYLIIVVF